MHSKCPLSISKGAGILGYMPLYKSSRVRGGDSDQLPATTFNHHLPQNKSKISWALKRSKIKLTIVENRYFIVSQIISLESGIHGRGPVLICDRRSYRDVFIPDPIILISYDRYFPENFTQFDSIILH